MAPEILQNQTYKKEVDIWTLGILLYILLTGTQPFPKNGNEDRTLIELIKTVDFSLDPLHSK